MMTIQLNKQNTFRKKIKKYSSKSYFMKFIKRRIPIIEWLPKYKYAYLIQDIIAGITVGLTAIPQGIAYAVIAGLPPEHGMYASLTSGVVYVFFGSCYNVTVGPTAILAAMTAKYVANYSTDFAIMAGFLSGVVMLTMAIFQLAFLVEFISMPVISGFTTAAALQIAASQLKSLFGVSGSSGNYFAESMYNFIMNIKTIKLWEPVFGFGTMAMLMILKKVGQGCKRTDKLIRQIRWFISLSRNAVVVIFGMVIAYTLKITINQEPLALIGNIGGGLPEFTWPPFTTVVGNETYSFTNMMQVLGPGFIFIPLVALLETIAISKAFSEGAPVDATQEMIAVGLRNIIGSFGQSMPITGSFARTALNHVSSVVTPAGGVTKVLLIVVALTSLTSTFYYIPKASLSGLIIFALFSMIDYKIVCKLWTSSKRELLVLITTVIVCLFSGLEYGIITGIIIEASCLLYNISKPNISIYLVKSEKGSMLIVPLPESVSYCAAEYVRRNILKAITQTLSETIIIVDGTNLKNMDFTVASNLMSVVKDLEKKSRKILLLNINQTLKKLFIDIHVASESTFVDASNILELPEVLAKCEDQKI